MTDPSCTEFGHIPSPNPRTSSCCRCGQPISREQVRPATRQRDLERERLITRESSSAYLDPTALIYYSEKRARDLSGEYVDDPDTVVLDRDRLQDVREELEDARNHLVWFIEENASDYRVADCMEALRGIVWVYQKLLPQ